MKTLEIRRHSTRTKPGEHLSQAGVTLARQVGEGMGPFDGVLTSTLPRAFETAIAMGFAVDVQDKLLNPYGGAVEKEVPWPATFPDYAAAVDRGNATWKFARRLLKFFSELAEDLEDDRVALLVSHGGVVEIGAVACLPDADHASWGAGLGLCEGVRLFWDNGKFEKAEILRISK
ncbi:MAG TPA: histidine phosphatase family protein [Anaerolineales bacterium]